MTSSIDGVILQDLNIISTPGGPVLHMLRPDSPLFTGFGEVYFSEVEPGSVKAWKRHIKQTQRFAVPAGLLKIVLYDDREHASSRTLLEEYVIGRPDAYKLLIIPPGIWYGFTALGATPALICNCPDIPHDPSESLRKAADAADIPYHW